MIRAAIYPRYSSNNQREESISAQLRACRDYCHAKKYAIVNEYTDEAKTGRNDDRPGYQTMLRDVQASFFDFLRRIFERLPAFLLILPLFFLKFDFWCLSTLKCSSFRTACRSFLGTFIYLAQYKCGNDFNESPPKKNRAKHLLPPCQSLLRATKIFNT